MVASPISPRSDTSAPTKTPQKTREVRFTVEWLPPYKVVVHNNDHNTFDEVIGILMKAVPGLGIADAIEHAYLIHETGATVPYTGLLDDAEQVAAVIRTIGIRVTVEPDVSHN